MKRCLLLCVSVMCAAAQNQPARYKAIFEPANVKADVKLFDAFFVSEQVGWVAGGLNETNGGVILYTEDGGKTWTNQFGDTQSADRAVHRLRFVDPRTGWAVQPTGLASRLLHTSDGQNWTQIGTIPEHIADYTFTSTMHGLYVEGGKIGLTNDGGQHWKPVATCDVETEVEGLTKRVRCGFSAIHFPTPDVGYATAKSGGAGEAFFVFKTTDGGATWRSLTIQGNRDAEDVFFVDANTGFVRTGYPDIGRLFRTTDGGTTFTGIAGAPGDRIRFADPAVGWAFHYSKMSYTSNAGDRWTSRSLNFPATVRAFSLPSRRRGYVVGDHGMVYRYSIVPAAYSVPGMIDAPMMSGFDLPVEAEVQKLRPHLAALRAKLQQAGKARLAAPGARFVNAFFQESAPAATFVQDTSGASAFVQDTTVLSAPAGAGVQACCAQEMQNLQNSFAGFTQSVPPMVTRYRSLNLLLASFHLFSDLAGRYQAVQSSFRALKTAPDAQAASTALAQFSTQLDQMVQSAARTMQTPVK